MASVPARSSQRRASIANAERYSAAADPIAKHQAGRYRLLYDAPDPIWGLTLDTEVAAPSTTARTDQTRAGVHTKPHSWKQPYQPDWLCYSVLCCTERATRRSTDDTGHNCTAFAGSRTGATAGAHTTLHTATCRLSIERAFPCFIHATAIELCVKARTRFISLYLVYIL